MQSELQNCSWISLCPDNFNTKKKAWRQAVGQFIPELDAGSIWYPTYFKITPRPILSNDLT